MGRTGIVRVLTSNGLEITTALHPRQQALGFLAGGLLVRAGAHQDVAGRYQLGHVERLAFLVVEGARLLGDLGVGRLAVVVDLDQRQFGECAILGQLQQHLVGGLLVEALRAGLLGQHAANVHVVDQGRQLRLVLHQAGAFLRWHAGNGGVHIAGGDLLTCTVDQHGVGRHLRHRLARQQPHGEQERIPGSFHE